MFIRMKRVIINRIIRTRLMFVVLISVLLMFMFGVHTHLFEKDFYTEFNYPLEGDIIHYTNQIRNKQKLDHAPINTYNYNFISDCKNKCLHSEESKLRLVYIVKSAMNNFKRRLAIRQSWGYESRFSDVPIKTVFLLGIGNDDILQQKIEEESKKFGDIVQACFIDAYFNNTIKTMIGFKWAVEYCSNSKFYFFSDDDMYVSTKNILRFVRNPVNYPAYLQLPIASVNDDTVNSLRNLNLQQNINTQSSQFSSRRLDQVLDFELPDDVVLYSGYVFVSSPHRHFTSKWYINLQEYPYHMWPPYVSAGAYILSKDALVSLYYGSMFTKHFRFDDIYLGIVAKKMNIEPFHCNEFYFYKKDYNIYNYKYTIASHGYGNPDELLRVWNEQRSANNA